MGQFLRVNGDYNIKTPDGSKIVLDVGTGDVRVVGNLVVDGEFLDVSVTDLNVQDNIITLNDGETGAGVTLDYSGIQIDRGSLSFAQFLWNENISIPTYRAGDVTAEPGGWQIVNGTFPSFNFTNSRLMVKEIVTDSGTDSGNLTLIGTGTGVVHVQGTINYEDEVIAFGDDALPNKRYVDDAILNNPTFQIRAPESQDTRVIIADKDVTPGDPGSPGFLTSQTGYSSFGASTVSVIVDNILVSQYYTNRVETLGLELNNNYEITTTDGITNQNIKIRTQGTGKLETNYAVQIERIAGDPAYVSGSTLVYAKTPDLGESGVWFANDSATASKRTGELISKNKALVFSMIF
jgi:hypothetical protein